MFNPQPKVSLGIPICNGENFLEACLESLLKQSFTDFEIIISDNATTDRTRHSAVEIFGLMRRDVMTKISPQGLYARGDSFFLARVGHIPELIRDCLIASEMVVQRT